ncbi:MAG: HDOD domain-containing protein [Deltaproteobacteria bacterium]|nr:HDOD domain-containing protein [Deltaproteobacteria bacterium]
MNFNGDLSKYHPADAIMFLSQLSLNGILSIGENKRLITLSFNNGFIIDAHSANGDAKILQGLIFNRRVTAEQVKRIRQIRLETGMSIRSILSQIDLFPLSSVKEILLTGMKEVLLEMFLLDEGAFNFTDTPVEADGAETKLDARMLALSIAVQSDEYRDFLKGIISLDREFSTSANDVQTEALPTEEQVVLRLMSTCRTLRQVLEKAPFDSGTVIAIIKERMEKGTITLLPADAVELPASSVSSGDPLFGSFRQAIKKLMLSDDPLKRIEALVAFCKGFYDGILILTAKEGQVVHCKQMRRGNGQGLEQRSAKGSLGALDEEPVLAAVHRSGVGFFGNRFPSNLLDRLSGAPVSGECALIPVVNKGQVAVFIYVFSENGFTGVSPQHYLELLSWMVTPRKKNIAGLPVQPAAVAQTDSGRAEPLPSQFSPAQLVSKIHELPPLPTIVTRALDMLSDPGVDIKDVEKVIGKDQSLVSKLIKISNSALYGGLNRVESLQQALTRLGAKTTKSLVLSASMQTYFIKSNPGMQTWGQFLWQHAAECGLAARRIAVSAGYDDPEKAFVGGVLHDIGKLVLLLVSADGYQRIQNLKKREALADHAAERKVIGTDHMEVGELLMEKWKMPESARLCVKFHHHVENAGAAAPLAAITAYANHLSHLHGTPLQWFVPDTEAISDELARKLKLSHDANAALVESVIADFQQAGML